MKNEKEIRELLDEVNDKDEILADLYWDEYKGSEEERLEKINL